MTTEVKATSFTDALAAFLVAAQAIVTAHDERTLADVIKVDPKAWTKLHTSEGGKTFVRVFKRRYDDHDSLYCFVEVATGNIYKGKGWKAPDKTIVRGNIYSDQHGLEGVDHHGARYAR